MKFIVFSIAFIASLLFSSPTTGQEIPVQKIKSLITSYKSDPRGPYKRIEWFCEDGTRREPRDPCPDAIGGGIQHASYKDNLIDLGKQHHLFFADILAATDKEEFWDAPMHQSRLKQYQLAKYLGSVDNGWVQEKSQFYRGALQIEDEQAWGLEFYEWLLKDDDKLNSQYYLIRQSLRDVVHNGDSNLAQAMRSQSKNIADEYPRFMDVRIKIHGQPDITDIRRVTEFNTKYRDKLPDDVKTEIDKLIETLNAYYAPVDFKSLTAEVDEIRQKNSLVTSLKETLAFAEKTTNPKDLIAVLSEALCRTRQDITTLTRGSDRLIVLDLTNDFENIILKKTQEWKPETLKDLLEKIQTLSYASVGTGLIENGEWEAVESYLDPSSYHNDKSLAALNDILLTSRGVVEWSAATVKANYQDVVDRYATFEPLALGFIDDRVRSSVALPLGDSVGALSAFITKFSNLENKVMRIDNQSSIRGLNPGYAYGKLVVVEGSPEGVEVSTDNIYIFEKPPSDLKPVAGIMTVSEGNLVSHVQLLARNLGIPNAALSDANLKDLKKYDGEKVFYAVSSKGNVILKQDKDVTSEEKALFSKEEYEKSQVTVPVKNIRLDQKTVLNMREVDASDSGKLCGPKAANLGQLKKMFPEQVVEGLVIPFGVFKDHMDQNMPGTSGTYWSFLNDAFAKADALKKNGANKEEVEAYQLKELATLRGAIAKMTLKPSFVSDLRSNFKSVFNGSIGNVPVFLRSDTNMEDLKEFTGAGLNLTLFNILDEEKILTGIKSVWASPYTERSFKWRQQYLTNPENVYPSILVIPSVDVAYSGVMITKGINVGTDDDLTVAFSRGAGGAVDGQAAETRLIAATSSRLLSPARQPDYIRLPKTGGVKNNRATFENLILNEKNIQDIRDIASAIRTRLPEMTDTEYTGAYDVELGFENDKLWLFQIRPFVENNNAKTSAYLSSIAPEIDESFLFTLDAPLHYED